MSKFEIRYYSKTGNTKKLADKIGSSLNYQAKEIPIPINEYVDILFFGASVYKAGIDKEVKIFINNLDKNHIGKVAIFSTSALVARGYNQIKKALYDKGIEVLEENFYCRGNFHGLHKNRPDENDLKAIEKFCLEIVNKNI